MPCAISSDTVYDRVAHFRCDLHRDERINLLLIIATHYESSLLNGVRKEIKHRYESIPARVIKANFRPSQHINQANFAAICDPSRCHTRIWCFTRGRWSRRLSFIEFISVQFPNTFARTHAHKYSFESGLPIATNLN